MLRSGPVANKISRNNPIELMVETRMKTSVKKSV